MNSEDHRCSVYQVSATFSDQPTKRIWKVIGRCGHTYYTKRWEAAVFHARTHVSLPGMDHTLATMFPKSKIVLS